VSYPQRSWGDGGVDDVEMEVVAARLWAGGVATALVAAGIAFVGVLIITSIFGVGIQTVGQSGALLENPSTVIPVAAGIAALAAAALLHLLLLTTPRPASFFSAIAVLVTVVLVLQVFLAAGTLAVHLATGILYAAIGAGITSMLSGVSGTSVRPAARRGHYEGQPDESWYSAGYRPPGAPPYPAPGPYVQPYADGRTARDDPRGRGR
jgi:hypothetical protein